MGPDVGGLVDHRRSRRVERAVEVPGHLGLAVDHDAPAGQALEVDAQVAAPVAEPDPFVDEPLPVHALADVGRSQRLDRAPLQHPGADAGRHVFAGLPFQHHRLDAGQLEQAGQQQPGGPAADDHDGDPGRDVDLHLGSPPPVHVL